jgi:acyl transferase domain-containing protein/NADP-dependent 3-hydroxy acid dehydrogenase YdfG/aryl carrier-like protein
VSLPGRTPTEPPTPLERALVALQRARAQLEASEARAARERQRTEPIAVVGLACRFPGGANDLARYWRLLDDGVDAVREIPPGRVPADPAFPRTVASAALLDDVERFDAEFFGISAREAERLDPQQRLLLEVTWEALETAGHAPNGLSGSRTGVYVSIGSPDYLRRILRCNPSEIDGQVFTGSLASVAAGRIAYLLGLQGPCMAIDTACSSSLVAVHQACQSLRCGESELALAGGVNLILSPESSYVLGQLQALSPDGRCKTFDARANGYVRGEGCGVVVLKRLADARRDGDRIWAVVRGSAVNQDGRSAGLTAPNMLAQQALLRQALHDARVEPAQIGYVEAHGTGTPLGDPIEIEALTAVLGGPRGDGSSCVLGAVKTNIGHLEAAAGVAGLIKAILAFEHERIPRNLHFRTLNPRISLAGTPFVLSDGQAAWHAGARPRLAAVSSFGISGTNAAVILGEPPAEAPAPAVADRSHHVVTLSARSPAALGHVVANTANHLRAQRALPVADLGFTSRVGRAHFAYRAGFTAASADELCGLLDDWSAITGAGGAGAAGLAENAAAHRPRIAFLFTGQGSQYPGMGRGLYRSEPVFRAALDRCAQRFDAELPRSLLEVMWHDAAALDQTLFSQPALFALEYALATLWRSWGVEPDLVLGHSLGEYPAATVAGVVALEDACRLVALRARACQALGPGGAMIAVEAEPAAALAVVAELGGDLAIAAYNAPTSLSLSGPVALVGAAGELLRGRGAKVKPIHASCAFHSPLMAPMVPAFAEQVARVSFSAPRVPWITNVTADLATGDLDVASYWSRQLVAPVRFSDCVRRARALGCDAWIEIGPHPVLLGAVSRTLDDPGVTDALPPVAAPSLRRDQPDDAVIARAVATLYEHGAKLDWRAFDAPFARRRVPLPTYPFERERHWFPLASPAAVPAVADARPAHPLLGSRLSLPGSEIHFATTLAARRPGDVSETGEAEADHAKDLDEHRIYGQVVVPAAHYVATFLAAVDEGPGGRAIEDVVFARALGLGDGEQVPVAVVVAPSEAGARLSFSSNRAGTDPTATAWQLHASATRSARRTDERRDERTDEPRTEPSSELAADLPTAVAADLHAEIAADLHAEIAADLHADLATDLPAALPADLHADLATDLPAALPADLPAALPATLAGLADRCRRPVPPARALASAWREPAPNHASATASPMYLGPRFRRITALWVGASEAVARIEPLPIAPPAPGLSAAGERSQAAVTLPVTVIDSCFQLLGAAVGGDTAGEPAAQRDAWMPIGIDHVELLARAAAPAGPLWAHARASASADGALVRGDVQLFDPAGAAVLRLTGVSLRRVSQAALAPPVAWRSWIYELAWRRVAAPDEPHGSGGSGGSPGAALAIVVLLDQHGAGERFAQDVEARGGAIARIVDPADLERDPPRDATHVVSFAALDGGDPAAVTARALALVQAAARIPWRRAPRLWWVTAGAQSVDVAGGAAAPVALAGEPRPPSVAQASLWGFLRCAALELPDAWGGVIDLDPGDVAGGTARLVDALSGPDDQLAMRSGGVFRARLEPLRRRDAAPAIELRADATYVISGGLGGIGWALAGAWIERGARHLVLLGRSGPSDDQQRRIAELAQRGVTVRTLATDVTDAAALTDRWDAVRAELPPVRGVVHAAGVLEDAAVLRQRADRLGAVIAPKLTGAANLARITGGADLEFFAMFSSLAGVLGSPGQASYAAANAGVDALVHELRARGVPALSIAWGPWDVGFAASHQDALAARGVAPLPTGPALEALAACLADGRAHVVVTAADLTAVAAKLPERTRPILERWTASSTGTGPGAPPAPGAATQVEAFVAGLLGAPPPRRRPLVLDRITAEIRRLLGRAAHVRIDPSESLFELGLDSLSAVQLRTALQRAFGRALPASLAFEYPTPDALAGVLLELIEADAPAPSAPVAAGAPAGPSGPSGPSAPVAPAEDPAAASIPHSIAHAGGDRGAGLAEALHALRAGQLALPSLSPADLAALVEAVRAGSSELAALAAEPIAIIGMDCRFPGGASSPAELWQLLARGGDAITEIPAERWDRAAWYDPDPEAPDKTTIRHGGFLGDVAGFDAGFFRISPREARCMDPQHRILLEVAWHALEDAGQDPQRLAGSHTGVFVGFMNNDYASLAELAELEGHLATGNGISNAVGRLSFVLGVHGPSIALDTACSSSLVAIHTAVESLRKRECDLALAGGVSLILAPGLTVLMSKLGGLALDGHCKTFDAAADGYVRSEGCGMLVLKRLAEARRDRDRVVAVIRGSAVNHGGRGGGFSQPNARAQQDVLRQALARSQTLPHQVSYLEAHGTGTPLGDPIEYRAAAAVYAAGRGPGAPLHIGSIKTNIGHAEAAAGVAGVIKVALALQARQIPPHRNLTRLNPEIDLAAIPARIPTELTAWAPIGGRRLAGVSGFGMSGINAHVILEEPGPPDDPPATPGAAHAPGDRQTAAGAPAPAPARAELVVLSAASDAALGALAAAYQRRLAEPSAPGSLHDIAGTAGARRAHHAVRLAIVAGDLAELRAGLDAFAGGTRGGRVIAGASEAGKRPRVVFVCPGQGSQWPGMGRELYATEPAFRDAIDRCDRAMQPYAGDRPGERLVDRLHAAAPPAGIDVIQPLLFAMSVALGALWRAWGIEPDAVVGHSMGEVAAAHLAGALCLDDAARIICRRSRLLLEVAGRGAMAMVELGAQALAPRLARHGDALCVAAANSTRSSVVTGELAAVEQLLGELAGDHVFARLIKVDVASHGPQVDPLARPLVACLDGIRPTTAAVPIWSSVTAAVADGAEFGPSYWMRNLREPVRFAETIAGLLASEHALFVELSPHPILAAAIEHTAEDGGHQAWVAGSLQRDKPERAAMLRALAELYVRGTPVEFRRLYPGCAAVPLPSYPFQHQRYWVEQVKTTPLVLRHRADLAAPAAVAGAPGPATERIGEPTDERAGDRAVGEPGPDTAGPVAWRARLALLSPDAARKLVHDAVAREARDVLGLSPDQPLSSRITFTELGMDSVMALRFMTRLGRTLDARLPTVLVFEHPTTAALAAHLASDVLALRAPAAPSASADPGGDPDGDASDDLSEDELADLLMRKLDRHPDPGS